MFCESAKPIDNRIHRHLRTLIEESIYIMPDPDGIPTGIYKKTTYLTTRQMGGAPRPSEMEHRRARLTSNLDGGAQRDTSHPLKATARSN